MGRVRAQPTVARLARMNWLISIPGNRAFLGTAPPIVTKGNPYRTPL
jgi:hypothetical protein